MRKFAISLLAFVLLVPARGSCQSLDAKLTGRWSGNGTFFKADLKARLGSVPITIEFKSDSASGRVGGATFKNTHFKASRGYIDLNATLTGAIGPEPELAKDHLVLLVTQVSQDAIVAEFHLKSNGFFDPRMREGRVTLTRVKP